MVVSRACLNAVVDVQVRSTETERSFPKSFCTRRSSEEIEERAPTLAKSTPPARVDLQHGAKGGRDEWLD